MYICIVFPVHSPSLWILKEDRSHELQYSHIKPYFALSFNNLTPDKVGRNEKQLLTLKALCTKTGHLFPKYMLDI